MRGNTSFQQAEALQGDYKLAVFRHCIGDAP